MKKKEMPKISEANILVLATTDNMFTQFLIPHIKDLIEMGAKVDCVCSRTGPYMDRLVAEGFNVIEIDMQRNPIKLANLKAYKKLKALVKEKGYNLIYCQQPVGGMLGRLLGKKFHLPVIYTAHGFFFFKGNNPLKNFVYRSAEKWLSKYTDVLITMNNEDYSAISKWKVPHKYKISGIGVDERRFSEQSFDKEEFRSSLGIADGAKVVLSVSEVNKNKNYDRMLESIDLLSKKDNNICYLSCGTGVLFDEMHLKVKKLGLDEKVKVLGYRNDVGKIMQISDVFFHESHREGLPISMMEAMYAHLPVVASNIRGNVDLIDDGKGGFITPCDDTSIQADALGKILHDDTLSQSMGDYNAEKVKTFLLSNVRNELKNIYEEIGLL